MPFHAYGDCKVRKRGDQESKSLGDMSRKPSAERKAGQTWRFLEHSKVVWLKTFLELPNGVPSHDTFGRVFGMIDAQQLQVAFWEWVWAVNEIVQGQVVNIDGKCLRGSDDQKLGKRAIYMVSAWAAENEIVLGQRKVDEKSNEITAIPELLKMLNLSGCIVTIDAMGTQTSIAKPSKRRMQTTF